MEVADDRDGIPIYFQAWEDSPSCNWLGEDLLLRIDGPYTSRILVYGFISGTYPDDTLRRSYDGYDISFEVTVKKTARPISDTIVISGTDGNESYGLIEVGENNYRYNADEQLYVIYVDCKWDLLDPFTIRTDHFALGMNTILLPRSVALDSKLNYTFADLQNRLTGTMLEGAEIYNTDPSSSSSSGSVIMAISVSLTLRKAERLLEDLTHAPSNDRIGDNTTVTGNGVYLLDLPADVLKSIPVAGLYSSELGDAPQEKILDVLVDVFAVVVEIILDFVITVANFILSLPKHIQDLGMRLLATLEGVGAQIAQAVKNAIDAIADAFNAFVTWAIELITTTLNAILAPIADAIVGALDDFRATFVSAAERLYGEYSATGTLSAAAVGCLKSAIMGPLFWIAFGIGLAVDIAVTGLSIVTAGTAFLASLVISMAVSMLLDLALDVGAEQNDDGLIGSLLGIIGSELNMDAVFSFIRDAIGYGDQGLMGEQSVVMRGQGEEDPLDGVGFTLGMVGLCLSMFGTIATAADIEKGTDSKLRERLAAQASLALGIVGIAICFVATIVSATDEVLIGLVIGVLGFTIATTALVCSLIDAKRGPNPFSSTISKVALGINGAGIGVAICSVVNSIFHYNNSSNEGA